MFVPVVIRRLKRRLTKRSCAIESAQCVLHKSELANSRPTSSLATVRVRCRSGFGHRRTLQSILETSLLYRHLHHYSVIKAPARFVPLWTLLPKWNTMRGRHVKKDVDRDCTAGVRSHPPNISSANASQGIQKPILPNRLFCARRSNPRPTDMPPTVRKSSLSFLKYLPQLLPIQQPVF